MNLNTRFQTQGWGLTVLRVATGVIFLMHAWQKFAVFTIPGFTAFLTEAGVPAPGIAAVVVSVVELIGGLALLLGVGVRWAALVLAFNMLVALLTVHLPGGFFVPNGVEFVLLLLAANIALSLAGGGALALESMVRRRRSLHAIRAN